MDTSNMNKLQLRSACRDAKVKGYSKMTVAAMRAALAKTVTKPPEAKVVVTPPKPKPAPAKKADKVRELKRPKAGGACAAVWDYLDKHRDATIADIKAVAAKKGWNVNNAACELYAWRKASGVASRGKRKLEGAIILEDGAAISIDEND